MTIGIDGTPLEVWGGRHGTGAYLRGLLGALAARSDAPDIVLFSYGTRPGDGAWPADRVRVCPLPVPALGRGGALFSHQLALPVLARRFGVSVLHIPGVSVNASMPAIPLWQPVPVVVTVHDLNPLLFPAEILPGTRHRIFYRAMLGAVRRAAHLLCDAQATRADLIARLGIPGDRITVAPLAADPRFGLDPVAPVDARAAGFEGRAFVLHVGGAGPTKNLARVLAAMSALWTTTTLPVDLVCVAALPSDPVALCPDVARHRTRVHALTDVALPFLRWLYQRALCLAFPSLYEGFGLPVLEAMASGCPVITSRVASLPEVAGDAAVYVDPLDVGAIREAVAALAGAPERRQVLREAGVRQARRFRYESTAEITLAVYERVAGATRPAR